MRIVGCIADGHNLWLVVVAGLICVLASHTAFSLLHRARVQRGRGAALRLAAAAVTMGSGVWATHFVAMLAYETPVPIGYDLPLTALSAAIAIAASGLGLWAALKRAYALGGLLAGAAVATMHYVGMAALKGPFWIDWDSGYIAASLVIGIGLSALAFVLKGRLQTTGGRLLAVGVLALSICGLHFTGMTAVTLSFDPLSTASGATLLERQSLAIIVAAVTALLLGIGMASAVIDGYLADRSAAEAERLRDHVAELEETQATLEATTRSLKLALEAAAASSQAKSQFLATMSHELRTPLNAIIGFSEIMMTQSLGTLGNARYLEYAGDIHSSGNHLLSLINDVLDFSKAEAGRLELQTEPLDAAAVLRDCVRLVALDAREAGIELSAALPEGLPPLRADRRRLKQIALNLLSNAIKFTPAGGRVRVSLDRDAGGIVMTFADTGVGMSPEQIPVALEAFGQVDSRLSRKYEGTGLGLPLSRHLAESHGGSLTIESALGEGTTVTVRLPAERARLSPAA
ncbi:MAG: hypothetical protein Kow00114_13580 [Kiloniellaceae bacterium]